VQKGPTEIFLSLMQESGSLLLSPNPPLLAQSANLRKTRHFLPYAAGSLKPPKAIGQTGWETRIRT